MSVAPRKSPVLDALVDLFYESISEIGQVEEVPRDGAPAPFDELLAHDHHMTVTVERFHGSPVDVHVLDVRQSRTHYARKITLTRQSDGKVVQFGLVRLCLDFLEPDVRREIESQDTPLGRILIEHNVLREVQLISLWKVKPAGELRKIFGLAGSDAGGESSSDEPLNADVTYGRTALIYCNGVPAVELLEIVAPL